MDPEVMWCSCCGAERRIPLGAAWTACGTCGSTATQSTRPTVTGRAVARALADVAAGRVTTYASDESFLDSLA